MTQIVTFPMRKDLKGRGYEKHKKEKSTRKNETKKILKHAYLRAIKGQYNFGDASRSPTWLDQNKSRPQIKKSYVDKCNNV